jgi:hypothetical protein
MLSQKDFNFAEIGKRFELDEVIPVYEMEQRTDDKGEVIKDKEGKPLNFTTDKLIGYNYSVTILDGQFRKKSTQVKVLDPHIAMTNEEIMKHDSVKCSFQNLESSMIGNPMYYKADVIEILEPIKK